MFSPLPNYENSELNWIEYYWLESVLDKFVWCSKLFKLNIIDWEVYKTDCFCWEMDLNSMFMI